MQKTAGNRLFQMVVRDDKVATQCIELLRKHKLGRHTFISHEYSFDIVIQAVAQPELFSMPSLTRTGKRAEIRGQQAISG